MRLNSDAHLNCRNFTACRQFRPTLPDEQKCSWSVELWSHVQSVGVFVFQMTQFNVHRVRSTALTAIRVTRTTAIFVGHAIQILARWVIQRMLPRSAWKLQYFNRCRTILRMEWLFKLRACPSHSYTADGCRKEGHCEWRGLLHGTLIQMFGSWVHFITKIIFIKNELINVTVLFDIASRHKGSISYGKVGAARSKSLKSRPVFLNREKVSSLWPHGFRMRLNVPIAGLG
jgi:hypothetical protein